MKSKFFYGEMFAWQDLTPYFRTHAFMTMADKIASLLEDEKLCTELGSNAHTIEEMITWLKSQRR